MTKKLDKEHLESITQLRNNFAQNTQLLGTVSIEEYVLESKLDIVKSQKSQLLNQFTRLQERESELLDLLKDRYGDGSVNIEDGTFTPAV
jgi:hypothetical protein